MKLSPRVRRWMGSIIAVVALFTITGFLVLPAVIQAQAEKRLSAALGRTVRVGKVHVNPYALSVTVEDFDVREKDEATSFVGWSRLHLNFDALSSLGREWVVSEVALDGFHARVAIAPDATFNFSDLLARLTPPAPVPVPASANPATARVTQAARPLRVARLEVTDARIEFSDHSRRTPFATTVGPLTFALSEFRTAGEGDAPYQFQAATEAGEKISWRGTLAADPLASRGEFEISDLVLRKYAPYLEDRIRASVTEGKLGLRGRYEARFAAGNRVLKLSDGQVQLRQFQLAESGSAARVVELPALDVTGISADAMALKVAIGRLAVTGGRLAVRREKDGALNLMNLLPPESAPPSPTTRPAAAGSPPAGPTPEVTVGEIAVQDLALDLTDLAAPRPVQLGLGGIRFSLRNFTLGDGPPMPIDLAFTWAPQGTVHVGGTVALRPGLAAELKTDIAGFSLLPLSPYLEQFVHAQVTQGTFSTTHTLRLALPQGPPVVEFAGDVKLENFGLVDGAQHEELAGIGTFSLRGLKATTQPQLALAVEEIGLAQPYARVVVAADHALNLATLLPKEASPPPPAAAPTPAAAAAPDAAKSGPRIEIGRVTIAGGNFSFADRSIEPHVRIGLTEFGGTIGGLSSENPARAEVDLKGAVDGAGPVALTGRLDPLGARKFVDLKIDFKNVDLVPLSPYAARFAGYGLARGKLVVDSRFLLDGAKIDAANVVTLHQFTFGTAVPGPDATKLPVRLGVALLKDLDGKIVIDLPVQGSLDDPNFRIGKVVLRVVVNLLTKAAMSPFSLLGSMFGGGGDELAYQEFSPGSTELQASGRAKLDTMVKALTNRPALSLGLEGAYDAAADAFALKPRRLEDLVRRRVWEERHAANPNLPPPDQLVLTPEERVAAIKALYDAQFPPGTQFGAPLPKPPAVVAPPAPPAGIVKRVIRTLTRQDRRERAAAQQENERRSADYEKALAAAKAAGVPLEEMSGRLAETIAISENDLRALATARARQVRDYLTTTGKVAPERLFLAEGTEGAKPDKGPRVFLSLQ